MIILPENTAATIKMGPFISETDGKTPLTTLTINQADVRLSKNGGDYAQKADATGGTHDENGEYDIALDTVDTFTKGRLRAFIKMTNAYPVWRDMMVVSQNFWNAMMALDKLDVNTSEINGSAVTGVNDFKADVSLLTTIDGKADSILADTGTTGVVIAQSTVDAVRDAVKAMIIDTEGNITLQQALSVILAFGAGTTEQSGLVHRSPNGNAVRIQATVAAGDRAAITLTPSA